MFKLESYLTPLILNYVDKYIKNLKPEDSQFSLWGGDAVFCNLDLRLDVLEQELQLPFTFVNGHIHELRIHVPWTKLGSEPVVITINTIECILKLCGDESASECGPQKIIQSKKNLSSRYIKKPEITEAPPGYVQSLINRVISNICIVCNNLILKYVEDDVVLSLNIKSAELLNVNEKWERAFVDTNLTDGIIRKVINMQDLTVCLDKRDASGKIETYQDPLLYRCSTTWRLYSIYNSLHSKYPSLTRIHMYCENLEFSLTDQQLPMFLRLLYLCVALQNRGTLSDMENSENGDENSDSRINMSDENSESFTGYSQDESWGSWAWSFIPEVPLWNSTNYEEQEEEANMLMAKKIFQFGIFIGKASCTLKQTVLSPDNIFCSPPKYTFIPLMILHFYGCSTEFTSKGKDFLNVQAGVSGATVTGLEDCVCGYQDFSSSDNERRVFLKSGVPPSSGHAYSYLSSSLFDPLAAENCGQTRKYSFNPDEHLETLTEEVMVQRFPAFAFDYLYELEIPEEWTDHLSNVTTTFLEDSNWHERSTCRLVFGPLCIDITSSFVHRLSKLLSSLKDYDYPSYSATRKLSNQNPDLTNDIVQQLEEFVPSRQYHLTLFKPVIRLFIADHYSSSKQDTKKGKKKRIKHLRLPKENDLQFYFEIFADCVDVQATVPMYPFRLVTIASHHPSQILLHHCYSSNSVKLFGLEMSLEKEGEDLRSEHSIIDRTSVTFFMKTLILPEKWSNPDDLIQKEYSLECTNLSLRLCEVRFLAAFSMFLSWTVKHLNTVGLQKLKSDVLNSQAGSEEVFGEMCDIRCSFLQSDKTSFTRGSVASILLKFQSEGKNSVLFHAPELTEGVHTGGIFQEQISDDSKDRRKLSFLQFILQIPEKMDYKSPPLFMLHISGSVVCLEPAFLSWLSLTTLPSFDLTEHIDEEIFPSSPAELEDESTCSSMTQDASISQTLTKSHSTIMVVNDHCEFHKRFEDILLKHSEFLSNLLLEV